MTKVQREEWSELTMVHPAMWDSEYRPGFVNSRSDNYQGIVAGLLCEVSPAHDLARVLFQTEDHRAIAACSNCATVIRNESHARVR